MKVYVYKDELYPYYGIDTGRERIEIPDGLYKRYQEIEGELREVQAELKKYSCEE